MRAVYDKGKNNVYLKRNEKKTCIQSYTQFCIYAVSTST